MIIKDLRGGPDVKRVNIMGECMSRGAAVFFILGVIAVVFSFIFPDNSKRSVKNAVSYYLAKDIEETDYDYFRERLRSPTELPFEYSFDDKEFDNGFEYEFNPNFKSGPYHKLQTPPFDCNDTIWYTTDGPLTEKNKTAYLYDPEIGIRLETGVTNICGRAE